MKRLFTMLCGLAVFGALAGTARGQNNPRGTSKVTLNGKAVSVEYGRPSLKGRTVDQMLNRLKPGQFWRLGADQSTTFSTELDLAFGDVTIRKGEYSIWARKEANNSWTLVFNKQHGIFGTDHDPAQDFASAPLKETKSGEAEEMLTLHLEKPADGGVFTIHWGDTKLSANFTAK